MTLPGRAGKFADFCSVFIFTFFSGALAMLRICGLALELVSDIIHLFSCLSNHPLMYLNFILCQRWRLFGLRSHLYFPFSCVLLCLVTLEDFSIKSCTGSFFCSVSLFNNSCLLKKKKIMRSGFVSFLIFYARVCEITSLNIYMQIWHWLPGILLASVIWVCEQGQACSFTGKP